MLGIKQEVSCFKFSNNFLFLFQDLGMVFQAHVYRGPVDSKIIDNGFLGNGSVCSAFLANIDERHSVTVKFLGQTFHLPPWSVSILPDCKNVAFNTAKVKLRFLA